MIACADCLHILKQIETESMDMIYLASPFSQKNNRLKIPAEKSILFIMFVKITAIILII